MNRRRFLRQTAAITAAVTVPGGLLIPQEACAAPQSQDFWTKDRIIECRRSDTGERRSICFYHGRYRRYDNDQYRAACWLLRDAKDRNTMFGMDVGILNLMYALQEWARLSGWPDPVITINSAYRTPARNATIEGAARNSFHIRGKAVDITMRGADIATLAQMAAYFQAGGIGVYQHFLHIDTGHIRAWRG